MEIREASFEFYLHGLPTLGARSWWNTTYETYYSLRQSGGSFLRFGNLRRTRLHNLDPSSNRYQLFNSTINYLSK